MLYSSRSFSLNLILFYFSLIALLFPASFSVDCILPVQLIPLQTVKQPHHSDSKGKSVPTDSAPYSAEIPVLSAVSLSQLHTQVDWPPQLKSDIENPL